MELFKAKRRPTDVEVLHRLFTESDREVATEVWYRCTIFSLIPKTDDSTLGDFFVGRMTRMKKKFAHSIDPEAAGVCRTLAENAGHFTSDERQKKEAQVVDILDSIFEGIKHDDGTTAWRFVFPDGDRQMVLKEKLTAYLRSAPVVYLIGNARAVYHC